MGDLRRRAFQIRDEEQSKRLQEVLFKQGYEWINSGNCFISIVSKGDYIFTNKSTKKLTYGDSFCISATDDFVNYRDSEVDKYIAEHDINSSSDVLEQNRKSLIDMLRETTNEKLVKQNKTAGDFLTAALSHMQARAVTYDSEEGERSMGKAVEAFNTITGHSLKESEGWLLLQILKDVRQWSRDGFHADSAEDCVAYAALKAESLLSEDKESNDV